MDYFMINGYRIFKPKDEWLPAFVFLARLLHHFSMEIARL